MCVLLFQDFHHIFHVNYDIVYFNCLKFIVNWSKFIISKRFRFLVYEPLLRSEENFSQDSDLFATELMRDPAERLVSLAENQNLENTYYKEILPNNRHNCVMISRFSRDSDFLYQSFIRDLKKFFPKSQICLQPSSCEIPQSTL